MKITSTYFNDGSIKVNRQDGTETWYDANGKIHRKDGPAITFIYTDFDQDPTSETYLERKFFIQTHWYWHGKKLEVSSLEEFVRLTKLQMFW